MLEKKATRVAFGAVSNPDFTFPPAPCGWLAVLWVVARVYEASFMMMDVVLRRRCSGKFILEGGQVRGASNNGGPPIFAQLSTASYAHNLTLVCPSLRYDAGLDHGQHVAGAAYFFFLSPCLPGVLARTFSSCVHRLFGACRSCPISPAEW